MKNEFCPLDKDARGCGEIFCKWWVEEEKRCAKVVEALALRNISDTLNYMHTDYFGAKEKS